MIRRRLLRPLARNRGALRIRPGRRRHVRPCAEIVQSWLDTTPWLPDLHTLPETERWLRRVLFPRTKVRVAMQDRTVAGFVAIDANDVVQALYVASEMRGARVGSALLNAAKRLRPQGLRLWTFQPNLPARRFYARHGFAEIRRTDGDNDEGVPDILLGWAPAAARARDAEEIAA